MKRRRDEIYGSPFEEGLFLNATLRHVASLFTLDSLVFVCAYGRYLCSLSATAPLSCSESNRFFNLGKKSSVPLELWLRFLRVLFRAVEKERNMRVTRVRRFKNLPKIYLQTQRSFFHPHGSTIGVSPFE